MPDKDVFEMVLKNDGLKLANGVTMEFNAGDFHYIYKDEELQWASVYITELIRFLEENNLITEAN